MKFYHIQKEGCCYVQKQLCCYHITLIGILKYGVKDNRYYFKLFGKTIWLWQKN